MSFDASVFIFLWNKCKLQDVNKMVNGKRWIRKFTLLLQQYVHFSFESTMYLNRWNACMSMRCSNVGLGEVNLVSKMEIMMKCFIFWKRVLKVFFYMLDLKGHLF